MWIAALRDTRIPDIEREDIVRDVMAFAAFPATEMRATALLLNIVPLTTPRLWRLSSVDWRPSQRPACD